jgi:hypothetical protein
LFFPVSDAYSDVGSCARFKVQVVLKSGNVVNGFVQICGYDEPQLIKGDSLIERITRVQKTDSIMLYKKIQTVNYPKDPYCFHFRYSAAAIEDRIYMNTNDINNIKILNVMPCENMDHINYKDSIDLYLINYTSQILDELTQYEINLMQTKPYAINRIYMPCSYSCYLCMNYNSQISDREFKRLCAKYLKNQNADSYKKAKVSLCKKGIIIHYIWSYN